MNSVPVPTHDFMELHPIHQHQPHCKQQCFVFTDIADIELPPEITKYTEKMKNGSIKSYKKEDTAEIQPENSNSRKIAIVIGVLLVCLALAGGIPLALQLRSSSLLEARIAFIRRLLKESPLVEGYWTPESNSNLSTSFTELKTNMVGAVLWPLAVPCGSQYLDAVQLALEGIDDAQRATKHNNFMNIVRDANEMEATHSKGKTAVLLGLGGGHAIGASLGVLRSMYLLGIRFVSITSLGCTTPWAASALRQDHVVEENHTSSLTEFGLTVLDEMSRLGMLVEISQLSEKAKIVALRTAKAPLLISNAAPVALCNSSDIASIPDRILSILPQNGGIVMLNIERCGDQLLSVREAINGINYIRALAGVDYVGLSGSPSSYLHLLAELARDRLWGNAAIKKLVGGNIVRVLREVELLKNRQSLHEEWIPQELIEGNSYCRYPEK